MNNYLVRDYYNSISDFSGIEYDRSIGILDFVREEDSCYMALGFAKSDFEQRLAKLKSQSVIAEFYSKDEDSRDAVLCTVFGMIGDPFVLLGWHDVFAEPKSVRKFFHELSKKFEFREGKAGISGRTIFLKFADEWDSVVSLAVELASSIVWCMRRMADYPQTLPIGVLLDSADYKKLLLKCAALGITVNGVVTALGLAPLRLRECVTQYGEAFCILPDGDGLLFTDGGMERIDKKAVYNIAFGTLLEPANKLSAF